MCCSDNQWRLGCESQGEKVLILVLMLIFGHNCFAGRAPLLTLVLVCYLLSLLECGAIGRSRNTNALEQISSKNKGKEALLGSEETGIPLRYLAINVGNAGLSCWESKLCDPQVSYLFVWGSTNWSVQLDATRESDLTKFSFPIIQLLPPDCCQHSRIYQLLSTGHYIICRDL